MLTISLKESIIIGLFTILSAIFIHIVIYTFGDEDIRESNMFYKHKKSFIFYSSLFIIGVLIHIFIKYIEYDKWYCQKICDATNCKVLCTLPFNNFTNLLITA